MTFRRSLPCLAAVFLPLFAAAQETPQMQVEAAEAAFWQAYNSCDHAAMEARIADDVEFYHDQAGAMKGRANLVAAVRNNICGNPQLKIRRDSKPGQFKTSVLKQGGQAYGVFVTGDHQFHAKHGSAAEVPEGRESYAHLWLQKAPGQWQLARVVSHDHQPFGAAPATAEAKAGLSDAQIDRYVGNYAGTGLPPLAFSRIGGNLTVAFEGRNLILHPLARPHLFLVKENNAEVEFSAGDSGPASALVVRMNGNTVGEARRK